MSRELERRLAALERQNQDGMVKAVSDLMDELSDLAAGGTGKPPHDHSLLNTLEAE